MIEAVNQLQDFGIGTIIMAVLLLICSLPTIGLSLQKFIAFFGIETKWSLKEKQEAERIKQLELAMHKYETDMKNDRERYSEIQADLLSALGALRDANKVALADRLNQRYKAYIRLQGIPEDEFDEFVEMHDAYKGVNGNHTIDAKFNKAMTLPTLTSEEVSNRLKELGGQNYDNV